MATKEATKIQDNATIALNLAERTILGVKLSDYVIKMVDTNKRGQTYIAVYKPESKEDQELVEMQRMKTANQQNGG